MTLLLKEARPEGNRFIELIESTGWQGMTDLGPLKLEEALRNSWYVMTAYEQDLLVGMGRIISDGVLQAVICDLIVLSDHQGKGVGSAILRQLLSKCREHGIVMVQLFAAAGKSGFYEKFGFEERQGDAPGMRWVNREEA